METIPKTRNWRHLLLACLLLGTVLLLARILQAPPSPAVSVDPGVLTESPVRTESPAQPELETSSSPDGEDLNLWAIPVPDEVVPGSSTPEAWKTMEHDGYMYSFQVPGEWIVSIPKQINRSRSRMVSPPAQDRVRVICVPFGIYDRPLEADMPHMDGAFLLHDLRIRTVTEVSSSQPKAGRFETRRRIRRFTFGDDTSAWMAVATYVIARPKCFALVLICPKERLEETMPAYERMVRSFDHWSPELH